MTLSNKLKDLRKQAGLSQEQMAERLNVSRQAITKWETDAGMPDIPNLVAIARLFAITVDELLGEGGAVPAAPDFFYESVTEFDVSIAKRYDFQLGSAREITFSVDEHEKVRVRLASNTLKALANDVKVTIDGHDVAIERAPDMTESQAREALYVFVSLPARFLEHTEVEALTEVFYLSGFTGHTLEFDGKAQRFVVSRCDAAIDINTAADMAIEYDVFSGRLDLNLVSSTASLHLPKGSRYSAAKKGSGNAVVFAEGAAPDDDAAAHSIQLRGFHAELVVHEDVPFSHP